MSLIVGGYRVLQEQKNQRANDANDNYFSIPLLELETKYP